MYNKLILQREDNKLLVKFTNKFSKKYSTFTRSFKGSYFDGSNEQWVVPIGHMRDFCRQARINKYYLSLPSDIQKEFNVNQDGYSEAEIQKKEEWRLNHFSNAVDKEDYDEARLEMPFPLLNYQRAGLHYAEMKHGRILLGDDMGLGKTIQAIGISKIYKNDWPVVVVAPASLLLNWEKEYLKWLPKDLTKDDVHVMKNGKMLPRGKVIICSFDYTLKKYDEITQFLGVKGILLVDEAQNIKNIKAKRTEAVIKLSHFAKRVVLMTGTPILNRVEELYSLLNAIDPLEWDSYYDFVFRYCDAQKNKFGLYVGGISNDEELFFKLREQLMCRRLKKDVLKQLPEKRRVTLSLAANKKDMAMTKEILEHQVELIIYSLHKNDNNLQYAKSFLLSQGSASIADTLFEAYRLTGLAKIDALCSWMEEKINGGLEKLIIFGHHKGFLNRLQEKIEGINEKRAKIKEKEGEEKQDPIGFMRIDGSTTKEKRFKNQEEFQENKSCNIALLSINAANSGLTLTAASVVVMGELPWTPGVSRQAEDRVHRIGQTMNVDIYYTIAEETFDGALWNMLQNKSRVASKVLDYGHGDEMEESIEMASGDLLSALIVDTYKRLIAGAFDVEKICKKVQKNLDEIEKLEA
jgi:SWI/SNF-related matrix-associated actin-dependent regulator 1 of chromatin subfamily A